MADQQPVQNVDVSVSHEDSLLPGKVAKDLRTLAHDLSNALEIVVQTSYLLSTVELREPATEWVRMLEDGVNRALTLNSSLRTYIREHSST